MTYKTVPGTILTSICDRYYLVTSEDTIQINETAAFYWEQLQKGYDEEKILQQIKEDYEIDDIRTLQDDFRKLTDLLIDKGLLVRSGL